MTGVLLPPAGAALRLPAVRAALVLLVVAPSFVAWWPTGPAGAHLRVAGMVLAAAVALAWEDRCAVLTAATPTGLPAVRRGRAVVVCGLLGLAWLLCCLAAELTADEAAVPYAAVSLQSAAVAATVVAVIAAWARGREGEPVLALPGPVLLLVLAALFRLPRRVSLLHATPGDEGWPAERTRWWLLLGLAMLVVMRAGRDPACPRLRGQHWSHDCDPRRPRRAADR